MRFIDTRRGRLAASLTATLALGIALAPAAFAGGNGATIVRGIQEHAGTCDDANPAAYNMTGTLQGCWIIDEFNVKPTTGRGTMLATGREHFTGWLDHRYYGTFYTTFTYTAQFDGDVELHGRCHHPLDPSREATGDFVGAKGEINFTDVLNDGPNPYYPYWGTILLGRGTGVTLNLADAPTTVRLASATLATPATVTAPC